MHSPFHQNTRFFPVAILLLLLSIIAAPLDAASAPDRPRGGRGNRPNVIFILADDLGYGDVGVYGQKKIKTPNLDRMAAEGMRFTSFYAGSTVCAPSRCVLMTGMDTGRCRVRGNSAVPLTPDDRTIATHLKQAGYATALIGKWGLGAEGTTGIPNKQGFDYFYGYLDQVHAHNYYPEWLLRNDQRIKLRNELTREGKPYENKGAGFASRKVDYSHDLFAAEALQWVEQQKDKPFFLYLALTIPHSNNEAFKAKGNGQEVPDLGPYASEAWDEPTKGHAAMISRMDSDIGRLLAKLKALGIDENTIVMFSSDNGPHKEGGSDTELFDSNGPHRGFKRDLYDGGIRVPFIVRWPGKVKAGAVSPHVAYFGDLFVTLAEITETKAPADLQSISFLPTLVGNDAQQKQHEYIYWEFHERGFNQAIRFGNYKAVRKAKRANPIEVYDVATDPGEATNIADQHPDLVAKAQKILDTHRTESRTFPIKE